MLNLDDKDRQIAYLEQQLAEKNKEIKHLNRCLSKRGLSEVDFYKRLREKEDEIEKLNKKILDWQDGSMALKIEKETRHQVCEEIRNYFEVNDHAVEFDYLNEILNQIEGE